MLSSIADGSDFTEKLPGAEISIIIFLPFFRAFFSPKGEEKERFQSKLAYTDCVRRRVASDDEDMSNERE